ncbi:MAG TPA: hypothetical protein EYH34_05420, partial [Planctomycetes bacterium]|nr:hypothetical protein [Planctomycetota bacterium]
MSPEEPLGKEVERLTKRLAKGSGVVFLGQVAGRFLGFGLQVLLGRFLGASGYGLYALSISTLEFGARLSQLGLANGLVRYVAVHRTEGNLPRLKGTLIAGFSLGSVAAALGALGLFLAAPWIAEGFFRQPALVWPLRLAALALPFHNLVTLAQSGLRGLQQMEAFTSVGVLRGALALLFSGALVLLGFGVPGAVGGFWAAALVALLLALWLLAQRLPAGTLAAASEPRAKELLRFSLPVYLAGFSYLIMTRTDIIMLGYFAQPEQVGAYRAAVALARLVTFGLSAINMAFAPMIAGLYQRKALGELGDMYRIGTRWGALLSLLVALPFLLYPKEVLGIYGAGFVIAAWPLVALVGLQLVNAGVGSVGFMLQMSGRQDWVMVNNLFTAALNVGFNLWWIPRWGILGAALATGTALAVNNLLGVIEVYRFLKMHPFNRNYWKLLLSTLPALSA